MKDNKLNQEEIKNQQIQKEKAREEKAVQDTEFLKGISESYYQEVKEEIKKEKEAQKNKYQHLYQELNENEKLKAEIILFAKSEKSKLKNKFF